MEDDASLSLWLLPDDIVLNVLARVPRRYHPILCCVSKKLRSIIRSSELQKIRSLLGKDCFYVCFESCSLSSLTYRWFILTENHRLVSIPFPSPPEQCSASLLLGPEIYFVGGGYFDDHPSSSMWILDSRSGKLREGPSMHVATKSPAVGIVDDKIYIIGGCENKEIQAQVFDPKTQTWETAANPNVEVHSICMSVVNPSLDKKIYAKKEVIIVYDPRDGNCEIIKLPLPPYGFFHYYTEDVCVIDNILYLHHPCFGLMWCNTKEKEWRVVHGLNLKKYYDNRWILKMAEYNGKLALLWHDEDRKEFWCAMIELRRNGVGEVQGRIEWSNCILSKVPRNYHIMHCLGRTD